MKTESNVSDQEVTAEPAKTVSAQDRVWLRSYISKRVPQVVVEDIGQEVFVRLLQRGEAPPIEQPRAYLAKIARSVIYDWREKASRDVLGEAVAIDSDDGDEELRYISSEDGVEIVIGRADSERIRNAMKPVWWEAFRLHHEAGFTYEEIAAELNRSLRQIKRYIFKANRTARAMLSEESTVSTTRSRRQGKKAILLSIAVLSLMLLWFGRSIHPDLRTDTQRGTDRTGTLTTQVGEHRCEDLPDYSRVCLNTNSVLHFRFDRRGRNLELVAGEASLVVQNEVRPLYLSSGRLLARDLHTSFTVRRKSKSTVLTVIEGQVQVAIAEPSKLQRQVDWHAATQLHELQQVVFDEATEKLHVPRNLNAEDLSQLLAWQQGRIDLNGRTLDEALEEFARYHPDARFDYYPAALGRTVLGGSVQYKHLDDFLDALKYEYGIDYAKAETDGHTVIRLWRKHNSANHSGK